MNKFRTNFARFFSAFALLLTVTAFSGCENDDGSFEGEFEVEMTDSKGDYARVDVEIQKVEVYNQNEGWVVLENQSRVYTVTDLTNGKKVSIASRTDLSAGTYTKLRLTMGGNSSIQASALGALVSFDALASQTVEMDINYNLESETKQTALIDFHVGSSVVETALGFELDPVVTWVENENTGVQGTLEGNVKGWVKFESGDKSFDAYTNNQGNFMIKGMTSGSYNAEIYPENASGFDEVIVVQNVQVKNGEITSMGTVVLN